MNPFNLEKALAGDPVITRGGCKVIRVIHLPEVTDKNRRLISVIELSSGNTSLIENSEDGLFDFGQRNCPLDLFMATKQRTVWVNMEPFLSFGGNGNHFAWYFDTQLQADEHRTAKYRIGGKAYPIEIEE